MIIPERYFCQKCGIEFKKNQKPCPNCGCINVYITKSLDGELTPKGFRKIGKKSESIRRFAIEVRTGWQPSGDKENHPEGIIRYQRFNRENIDREDSYQEKIIDVKTGIICRDFKEPLSQHEHGQV